MKLIKCKKCGTPIATDKMILQRLLDGMEDANTKARKAKSYGEKCQYIQEASQYKQIIKSITHATTQLEQRKLYIEAELKALIRFLVDNNLLTYEKIGEIQEEARKKIDEKIKEEQKQLNKLYKDGYNQLSNNSKKDPTSNKVISKDI